MLSPGVSMITIADPFMLTPCESMPPRRTANPLCPQPDARKPADDPTILERRGRDRPGGLALAHGPGAEPDVPRSRDLLAYGRGPEDPLRRGVPRRPTRSASPSAAGRGSPSNGSANARWRSLMTWPGSTGSCSRRSRSWPSSTAGWPTAPEGRAELAADGLAGQPRGRVVGGPFPRPADDRHDLPVRPDLRAGWATSSRDA